MEPEQLKQLVLSVLDDYKALNHTRLGERKLEGERPAERLAAQHRPLTTQLAYQLNKIYDKIFIREIAFGTQTERHNGEITRQFRNLPVEEFACAIQTWNVE